MGLNTKRGISSNNTYLKLGNGMITREWQEEPKQEGIPDGLELKVRTIEKGKNEGKERWYVEYTDVSGYIINVELKKYDTITIIDIYLKDGIETFVLSIPEDSSYGRSFMFAMRNIDLTREIVFVPWTMTPEEWVELTGGKKPKSNKVGLTMYHDSIDKKNKIERYYTRDTPNGLPELKQETLKGELKYVSTDRDNFLFEELVCWVFETSQALNGPSSTVADIPLDVNANEDISDDDFPF